MSHQYSLRILIHLFKIIMMNKKEREIQLADMHDDGIRFSETVKAQIKEREERLKKIEEELAKKSND